MIGIKSLVVGCLLAAASASVFASSWHLIFSSDTDIAQFFDAESVEKSPDGVSVWLKLVRLNAADAQGVWSSAIKWRIHCTKKTIQWLARSEYDQNNKFIRSYEGSPKLKAIVPDSKGDEIARIVCQPDFPRNTSEKDYIKVENNDVFIAARVWAETLRDMLDKAPK